MTQSSESDQGCRPFRPPFGRRPALHFPAAVHNLVYDEDPDDGRFDEADAGLAPFEPFWGLRYNLASGLPVNPLRSSPLPGSPDVLLVIDPIVEASLKDHADAAGATQHDRLVEFIEAARASGAKLRKVDSKDSLRKALKASRPDVMYWLCHADPGMLQLGADRVTLTDLNNMLRGLPVGRSTNGLVILNACQTAQPQPEGVGSFLKSFHDHQYCGIIATEERTLDVFANPFGLALLRGFLEAREPIGRLLRRLRRQHVPLGLLYGTYCPAHLELARPEEAVTEVEPLEAVSLATTQPAAALGVAVLPAAAPPGITSEETRSWPPLPPGMPYLPLGVYGPEHRALFAGRDADIERFAMLLDHAQTRILVLHGESGAGKSSFLRAGLIPYLEDECIGYRFLRERDDDVDEARSPVLFVRSTDDPLGQLAQSLCAYCRRPFAYTTPTGRAVEVDLPARLSAALGRSEPVGVADLRAALRDDVVLLGRVLAALSAGLPYTLVVVVDQAEEMFTLFEANRADSTRDGLLEALRHIAGVPGDYKLIVALRTEYHGRLVDRLRRGVAETQGVREYLLTDLDHEALVEAIRRPTELVKGRYSTQIPQDVYGFRYAPGVAEEIAADLIRAGRRDGVLPLVQFVCDQLYRRARQRPDTTITGADYKEGIHGLEGGLRRHLERQLEALAPGQKGEQGAFRELLSRLSHRQVDGTMTTDLVREEDLARHWRGRTAFPELLDRAEGLRLLRFSTRRLDDGTEERSISLGHDALAKVAAAWRAERERREQARKWALGVIAASGLALVFAFLGIHAYRQKRELAQKNLALATTQGNLEKTNQTLLSANEKTSKALQEAEHQERIARARLVRNILDQVEGAWRSEPERGLRLLTDIATIRLSERDFAWGYYFVRCNRVRVLKGHGGFKFSVAFSPDGKTLASGGYVNTVWLWDAATGEARAVLKGHEGYISSVAFSPDGKTLASASQDKTVRLWDAATGEAGAVLKGHEGPVSSVAFSPDGKTLASGGYDKTVRLWDAASGEARAVLKGHEVSVISVAFSPDGKALASGGGDHTTRLWDAASGEARAALKGHEGGVISVAFSPDGKTLASGGGDRTIRLWDAATGEAGAILKGHEDDVSSVAFSPDGKTLASASRGKALASTSRDKTVRLWDTATGEARAVLKGHESSVISVAFSPDGKTLASASQDKTVRLWDAATGEVRAALKGHEGYISSVAFSPDGKALASASQDKTVRLWAAATGQARAVLKGHEGGVSSVAFSPDGKTLASGGGYKPIRLWDAATGQARATLKGHADGVWALAFSPDGKTLASGSSDKTVRLWDSATGQARATLKGHELYVHSVAFSPDGKALASGGGDRTIRLWDAATGEAGAILKGHEDDVSSVAFSPDGKTLASGSRDKTIRLWDAATGQTRATVKGHEGVVNSVAFSPDGKTLASGSDDRTIRLWDAATGEARAVLKGHEDDVSSVAFSPDGKTLASGSGDSTVRLWDAATEHDLARPHD